MRWSPCSLIAVVFISATCCKKDDNSKYKVPCGPKFDGGCYPPNCNPSGNSPSVNIFPANGLFPGKCNGQQLALGKWSLRDGHCPPDMDLVLDDTSHRLVGKKEGVVCEHKKLEGSVFSISGPKGVIDLKIEEVKDVSIGSDGHVVLIDSDGSNGSNVYEGYKITYHGNEVCDPHTAQLAQQDLGVESDSTCSGSDAGPAHKHGSESPFAIAVGSPVFAGNGTVLLSAPYFNIACVEDALAKTTFFKLNTTPEITSGALRMITARYFNNTPFTTRDMPIGFSFNPGPPNDYTLEANWDSNGKVTCISTPRLLSRGSLKDIPACDEPTGCQGASCSSGSAWVTALRAEASSALGSDIKDCAGQDGMFSTFSDMSGSAVVMVQTTKK